MRKFTVKPKSVEAATTVRTYQNKRNPNKYIERHDDGYGHRSLKQYMQWDRDGGTVKNPTGDGNLHRWRKKNAEELLEDYNEIYEDEGPVDEFGNPVEQYPNPEIYGSSVKASSDPYEPSHEYDWMVGIYWSVDWHELTITEVDSSLGICKVTESWIAEDTGEDVEHTSTYRIRDDGQGHLYIQNKKYPDYKLYLQNAFNYDSKVPKDQNEFEREGIHLHDEDYDPYEYGDEEPYTPSATRGDYSPSNPWDAPGMSIHDFI